jgi:hypothetical protein
MYRFNHPSAPNTRPEQKPEQLNRSTTPGGVSWKKALAISAVPLALLFGAAFQSPNSVPGQLHAIQAQLSSLETKIDSLANKGPRQFYLTKTSEYDGAEALSACAPGYHMASMWEIHDASNVRYNTDLGYTLADSGFGPPIVFGWIRTGAVAADSGPVGGVNCNAWTSRGVGFGVRVRLTDGWPSPAIENSPWSADGQSCNTPDRVWCVQD